MVMGPDVDAEFGKLAGLVADPRCAVCISERLLGVMALTVVEV